MNPVEARSLDQLKKDIPNFRVGDTVRVHVQIKEGDKERVQVYTGTVIARKHGAINETFCVRRVAYGVAVERIFPLHSPRIAKIEVESRGDVKRAKLYYLRDRVGKAAKIREKARGSKPQGPAK